jgi:hypothetical protein
VPIQPTAPRWEQTHSCGNRLHSVQWHNLRHLSSYKCNKWFYKKKRDSRTFVKWIPKTVENRETILRRVAVTFTENQRPGEEDQVGQGLPGIECHEQQLKLEPKS